MEQIISDNLVSDKSFLKVIRNFFNEFNFSEILRKCKFHKTDGFTFLPLLFRFVCSKNRKNIKNNSEYVKEKYAGYTRRVQAKNKKTNRFSVIVWLNNFDDGIKTKAKILFIKEKKNWLALLSTDVDLDNEEIIKIYGMRWDIEVFFKMCKSHLKLAKEFQGRSFNMIVAHTSIVYLRYIMLTVMVRKNNDERTFGDLFFHFSDEVRNISFFEALQLILTTLKDFLKDKFLLTESEVQKLLSEFIDSLPPIMARYLPGIMCES